MIALLVMAKHPVAGVSEDVHVVLLPAAVELAWVIPGIVPLAMVLIAIQVTPAIPIIPIIPAIQVMLLATQDTHLIQTIPATVLPAHLLAAVRAEPLT